MFDPHPRLQKCCDFINFFFFLTLFSEKARPPKNTAKTYGRHSTHFQLTFSPLDNHTYHMYHRHLGIHTGPQKDSFP